MIIRKLRFVLVVWTEPDQYWKILSKIKYNKKFCSFLFSPFVLE